MNDEKMSSSEVAYRAVREYQDAQSHSESIRRGPLSADPHKTTPGIVWGAFFGLIIGAFSAGAGSGGVLKFLLLPALGMAIGALIGWIFGKLWQFTFTTLPRMLIGGVRKIAKDESREPPA